MYFSEENELVEVELITHILFTYLLYKEENAKLNFLLKKLYKAYHTQGYLSYSESWKMEGILCIH